MMASLNLHRDFRRYTHGPYEGMVILDQWYPHEPLDRYRICFSSKVWDSMISAARSVFEFDMRIKASEALTPQSPENGP